ncbi:NAD-dependent epimerase/dehydratase family protein [Eubacterium limosum]|uniref:NAD-dependent epimerase/dehydratase family protein n=1 Tax=Eubacterium limosum TaxID=1736 RepID=UPI00370FF083
MEKKKIVVTGASGYIGRHVVKEFLDMGHIVYAVDIRFNDIDKRANRIEMSVFDNDKDVYERLNYPDIVVHLAWRDGFFHNSHKHISDLSGHYSFILNLLEGGLKHIVVMGSMHEIGYWEGSVDEDTPTNPLSYYGIAKNSLRQSVELLAKEYGAIYQWLRAYYVLGDDAQNNSIFTKIMQSEEEGKKDFPFTSGENKYDFINVDELAMQIAITSIQNRVTGIINCCSGKPVSLGARVEQFLKEKHFHIKLQYGMFPDRPYDSPAIWGNDKKIKMILENKDEQ